MLKIFKNKKGFSLVELVVVIAIMAIVATIAITTYTSQIQEKRREADLSVMKNVETQMGLLFSYESDFQDVKTKLVGETVGYEDTFILTLVCKNVQGKGKIKLSDSYIKGSETLLLKDQCPVFYKDLCDSIGQEINMQSNEFRVGTYTITCVFDGVKLSSVREFSVTNDAVVITGVADFKEEWKA